MAITSVGVASPTNKVAGVGVAAPAPITSVGNSPQQAGYTFVPGGSNGVAGVFRANSAAPSSVDTGAGGGATTGSTGYVDPFSASQHQFLNELPTALSNIGLNANDAFASGNRSLTGNAQGIFNNINAGQKGINTARENVELNRLNGVRDILGFVRNGLQGASTRLSNTNSLGSSASEAIARGYSHIANDQAGSNANQAFIQNHGIDANQESLNTQKTQSVTDFHRLRDETVANITSQVRNQLMALDQQARGLSLPDRIQVEQEKQKIVNAGVGQLNSVDQWLQDQMGSVNPESADAVRTNAAGLQTAGTGTSNPWNLNLPGGPTTTGPAIGQLPLFVRSKKTV